MTVSHPDPAEIAEIAEFMKCDLAGRENRRIVRTLLATWRVYRREFAHLWSDCLPPSCDYSGSFEGTLDRIAGRVHRHLRERERLPELIGRVRLLSREGQRRLLRSDPDFRTWCFCEWLTDECNQLTYVDLNRAEDLANLAVAAAEALDPDIYGASLVYDLQARAWAAIGEVLRILSDLRSADDAFAMAESLVEQGTGDALEEARILEFKAALRRDQQRPAEAHRLLDEIIPIYQQYRDVHLVGRAFVQKGKVFGASNDLDSAVRWLRKGLGLIDSTRDRRFDLSARHSLMLYLHESGRHQEAWFLLKASRPEFLEHGGEILRLRLRWLEGKIQQALESLEEAEAALAEARAGFVAQGIGFSAASVSLDLAGLYAAQGRATEMRRVAEEMLPVFQARDLHREAIAALIVFQQAVRMEKVNTGLLSEIRTYLRRARKDHKLRFEVQA
jgi:tetratricopeptide (TPR) repeat protein